MTTDDVNASRALEAVRRATGQRGSEEADARFLELYVSHDADVLAVCTRIARDATLGNELARDTWVRVWLRRERMFGVRDEGAWIRGTAVNVALEASVDRDHTPEPDLHKALVLASLPARARSVYRLHDVESFTLGEIAELLGVAPGMVRVQLARARLLLGSAGSGQSVAPLREPEPVAYVAPRMGPSRRTLAATAIALVAGTASITWSLARRIPAGVDGLAITPAAEAQSPTEVRRPARPKQSRDEMVAEDEQLVEQIDGMIAGSAPVRGATLEMLKRRLESIDRGLRASDDETSDALDRLIADRARIHQELRLLAR